MPGSFAAVDARAAQIVAEEIEAPAQQNKGSLCGSPRVPWPLRPGGP
jgi:hypothetical protein